MLIVHECMTDRQTGPVFSSISRTIGFLEPVLKISSKEQLDCLYVFYNIFDASPKYFS